MTVIAIRHCHITMQILERHPKAAVRAPYDPGIGATLLDFLSVPPSQTILTSSKGDTARLMENMAQPSENKRDTKVRKQNNRDMVIF